MVELSESQKKRVANAHLGARDYLSRMRGGYLKSYQGVKLADEEMKIIQSELQRGKIDREAVGMMLEGLNKSEQWVLDQHYGFGLGVEKPQRGYARITDVLEMLAEGKDSKVLPFAKGIESLVGLD